MSTTSILIVFIITALIGFRLFMLVRKGERRPIALVAAHGLFAVTAYGLLIYRIGFDARASSEMQTESYAFVFFSFAAVGGFTMLITDKIFNKAIPNWLPLLHGLLAAIGLVILIISTVIGA